MMLMLQRLNSPEWKGNALAGTKRPCLGGLRITGNDRNGAFWSCPNGDIGALPRDVGVRRFVAEGVYQTDNGDNADTAEVQH